MKLFRGNLIAAVVVALVLLAGCSSNGRKSLERGKQFMKEKDYARALLEFRNAQRHFPKDADVIYHVATGYLATGDLANGVRHLRLATQLNPNHAEAQLKLAELMAMNQSSELLIEAEKRAKQALAASTDNADAVATLAFAELRLGKFDEAQKRLQEVIDKSPQALKAAMVMANLQLSRNEPAKAEATIKRAVDANPKSWEAWFSLSRFYLLQKRTPEAESAVRKVIEIDPTNELAMQDLAAMLLSEKKNNEAEDILRKLSAHPSKKFLSVHAMFLFQQNRKDEGLQELESLFKANPKNRQLRTQLAAGYLAVNKRDLAEKMLNEALKDNPRDVDALLQRGQIHLLNGKLEGLEADMNEVLRFRNDSGEAHYLLARVHRARGNVKNEERELYEALKLAPGLLAARVDMAQRLIGSGGGKAALDILEAAPQEQKGLLPVVVQRNWALLAMNDLPKVRESLKAAQVFGKVPDLMLQEALLDLRDKKFAQGRALLHDALKVSPNDIRILQVLAESHLAENNKNIKAAVDEVQNHAAQNPKSLQVQQIRGSWLTMTGDLDGARKAFQAAKEIDPGNKAPVFALAQVDMAQGNLESARKGLSEILAKDPRDGGALLLVAMLEEKAGNVDKATQAYRKTVEMDGNNALALNNLAYRLVSDTKNADEALKLAQKAKEVSPQNAAIDDTLGWIYYQKGLYSSAVKHLEAATGGGQNGSPVRLFHLAMAYHKSGNPAKARDVYARANKIGALLPEAALAKQTLGVN